MPLPQQTICYLLGSLMVLIYEAKETLFTIKDSIGRLLVLHNSFNADLNSQAQAMALLIEKCEAIIPECITGTDVTHADFVRRREKLREKFDELYSSLTAPSLTSSD